jgi:hypothetical protein
MESFINYQYSNCLIPSNPKNRDFPTSENFGNGIDYKDCIGNHGSLNNTIYPQTFIPGPHYKTVPILEGNKTFFSPFSKTDLQKDKIDINNNIYIELAAKTLGYTSDLYLALVFCDSNINHLISTITLKIKELTTNLVPEGLSIQVDIEDFFNYMISKYRDQKVYNGSICFVNLKKDLHTELIKLNTDIIQDYVTKMISQLNMYMYYYKDASQIPEQLSLPLLTSAKGSRSLEYNIGLYNNESINFYNGGSSIGVANFNEAGNII